MLEKSQALFSIVRTGNLGIALRNRYSGATRRLYRRPVPRRDNWSVRRINKLHAVLPGMNDYLEIGVAGGGTIENVAFSNKVGVDPLPQFDTQRLPPGVQALKMTSDEFFATNSQDFDLVFLDGLHEYRQTYRDFINSFRFCRRGGLVLVDDVVPSDAISAMPSQDESLASRRHLGLPGTQWHGDVFRLVLCLSERHPEIDFRTIVGSGTCQLLAWRIGSPDVRPIEDDVLSDYGQASYEDVFSQGVPPTFRPSSEADALSAAVAVLRRHHGSLGSDVDG